MDCSGRGLNTWRWEFWLMRKPFKWLLWLMPVANPKKASKSTMELGRGLETTKDSTKKKWRSMSFFDLPTAMVTGRNEEYSSIFNILNSVQLVKLNANLGLKSVVVMLMWRDEHILSFLHFSSREITTWDKRQQKNYSFCSMCVLGKNMSICPWLKTKQLG